MHKVKLKRLISLIVAMIIVTSSIPPTNVFTETNFKDIKGDEYYAKAAELLFGAGIIEGYPDGTFGADKPITRSEMAAIVCRLEGYDTEPLKGKTPFSDIPENHWATGYINKASLEKIIQGDGDGKFRPDDNVLYEEAIKMIVCASGYGDEALNKGGWMNGYLEVAEEKGILKNVPFEKGTYAVRGAIALMLYQAATIDLAAPTASVKGGTYSSAQSIVLQTTTKDAKIYYTLDGKTPTTSSQEYTKPIMIDHSVTLKAVTVTNGVFFSQILTENYSISRKGSGGVAVRPTYYTVSFDLNYTGATNTISAQSIERNATATKPSDPTRSGYTFGGWYMDSTVQNPFDFNTGISSDITLYARWIESPSYTVTFDLNYANAINQIEPQQVVKEECATKPADPAREGYIFGGWFMDSTVQKPFDFNTGISSDITLYARWVENENYDELAEKFLNPPDDCRPTVWWRWMGTQISKDGITKDLEAMKKVGIGGVVMFQIDTNVNATQLLNSPTTKLPKVTTLSPEWWTLIQHAIKEADRLGLSFSMQNCLGYSTSGGPWITAENSMQKLVWTEKTVTGGQEVNTELEKPSVDPKWNYYKDIAVIAVKQNPDNITAAADVINISDKMQSNGNLLWDAPDGTWKIVRYGHTTTGKTTHPTDSNVAGLECDKLNRDAMRIHYDNYIGRILKEADYLAGKSFDRVLIDSFEAGEQNWTPKFREEFMARRGYDPLVWLPVISGSTIESQEIGERFKFDMEQTIAELCIEESYMALTEYVHEHPNVKLEYQPYHAPYNLVAGGVKADIVSGEFWHNNMDYGWWTLGLAASSAHISGKSIVASEAFTSSPEDANWSVTPADLKAEGDLAFSMGANAFEIHTGAHQPWDSKYKPGMIPAAYGLQMNRNNTWWEQGVGWTSYLTRSQYMLRQGSFVGDLCFLYPKGQRGFTPPAGYKGDAIDEGSLIELMSVDNGDLVLPSGMRYKALVLSDTSAMSEPLAQKLKQLVADGATIIGNKPTRSPSLTNYPNCDQTVAEIGDELWGSNETSSTDTGIVDSTENSADFKTLSLGKFELAQGTNYIRFKPSETNESTVGPSIRIDTIKLENTGKEISGQPSYVNPSPFANTMVPVAGQVGSDNALYYKATKDSLSTDAPYSDIYLGTPKGTQKCEGLTGGYTGADVGLNLGTTRYTVRTMLNDSGSGGNAANKYYVEMAIDVETAGEYEISLITPYQMMGGTTFDVTVNSGDVTQEQTGNENNYGKGKVVYGKTPAQVLQDMSVAKDFEVKESVGVNDVAWTHRRTEDADIYFVSNQKEEAVNYNALFRVNGKVPEIWNNETGKIEDASIWKSENGRTSVNLKLEPLQSIFVVFRRLAQDVDPVASINGGADGAAYAEIKSDGLYLHAQQNDNYTLTTLSNQVYNVNVSDLPNAFTIEGSWDVTFPPNWGAPAKITLPSLISLKNHPDKGVQYFSGTATYTKKFEISGDMLGENKAIRLDLGNVKNFAEVSVNGKNVGLLWKSPYIIDITKYLVVGENLLAIDVTNTWANRMIGDMQEPLDVSYGDFTFTSNGEPRGQALLSFPDWFINDTQRPSAGRYTFSTWNYYQATDPLPDSGLIGPVRIIPEMIVKVY